jgi:hypothetical protein
MRAIASRKIADVAHRHATRRCTRGSIRSHRVVDVLSKLVSVHGAPTYLRCDTAPNSSQRRS